MTESEQPLEWCGFCQAHHAPFTVTLSTATVREVEESDGWSDAMVMMYSRNPGESDES